MNILILGGTQEAQSIAKSLTKIGHKVLYSVAGLAGKPDLNCSIRSGGFGGVDGLGKSLVENAIDVVVDATHPYAATISEHAAQAARQQRIFLVRYTRPPWEAQAHDNWKIVANNWPAIVTATLPYRRPFFTIGRKPLVHISDVPKNQQWLIRTLDASDTIDASHSKVQVLRARGPFAHSDERALMLSNGIDVLVSKNSGGNSIAAKVEAARELRVPVIMLKRPALIRVEHEYDNIESLIAVLGSKTMSAKAT